MHILVASEYIFGNSGDIDYFWASDLKDMIEIRLPEERQHRLPFFLAMEEWVAKNLPPDDYIFSWRVNPTVICGRNQDIALEVDLPYCRAENIDVVRRRSGGGCVYADMNNYMFSFVTPGGDVEHNYARYTTACASMLKSLGVDATVSGRNDILVNDAKIAGNAFYRLSDRSIVHGTMLYDFDPVRLSRAITPSKAKLESKAVKSVGMRVTSLKEQKIRLSLEEFGTYAIHYFCSGRFLMLSDDNVREIEKIEKRYYDPVFLFGKAGVNGNTVTRKCRIENVGEFQTEIAVDESGFIASVELRGDFFALGNLRTIETALKGVHYEKSAIKKALQGFDISGIVRNLDLEQLCDMLI